MTDMTQVLNTMTDKEIVSDLLISQKHLTSSYNTYAGECVNAQLKDTMLNILKEEHCIQSDLFSDMSANGWYQTTPAEQQKIDQTKQKFPINGCSNS